MATGEKSSQVRSIRWVLLPAILLLLAVVVKVYNYHPGSIRLVGYSFLQIAATSTAHLISQASPISAEDSFAITQTALTGLLLFFGGLGTYLLAFVLSKKCYPQPVVGWGALTAGALSIITVGSNALNHPEIASLWIATGWSGWIILKVNKTGQWRWLGWVLFVAILGMDLFLHSTTTLIYIIFCASILLWQIATSTPRKISSSIAIAITLVTMITLLIMVAQPRPAATIDFQATGILHVLGINAEIETYQLAGILLIVTSFVGLFLSFRRSLPIIGGWVLCTAIMLDPKLASIEFVYLSCSIIAGISIAFGNGNLVAQIANSMWHQNTRNLGLIPAIILSTFALLANIQILNGTAWEWYQPNSDLASLLAKVPPGSRVLYLKDNLAENALITTLYNNQPPVNNDLQRIKNTLATTSDHELIIRTLQQAGFTAVITDSYAPLSIASINNELLVTARGYYYLLVVAGNQPKLQALMATNDLSPARTENPIDHPLISGNYITSSTPNSFYLLRSTPEFVSNEEFEIPVTLPGKLVADDYWQREKWLPAKVYARIAGERKMEMKLEYTLPSISQAGIELFPVAPVTEIVEVSREKLLISGGIGGLISVNPQTDRFVLSGEVLLDAQGKILAFGENQVETVSYIPKFDDCPITESSALGRQCATISAEPTIPTSYLLTIETSVLTDIQNVCIDPEHAEGCAYRLATQSFVVPGGDIKISLQSSGEVASQPQEVIMRYYPLVSEHTVETAGISELIEYTLPVNTQSPLSIKYNIDPSIDFTPHSFLQSLRVENGPYVPTQIEILHQYVSLPGFHFLKLSGEGVIALREEWRDDWQVWGTTSEYLTVNGVHPGWHLLVGENPHRVLIFSPQALISNWWPAFIFLELCLLAAIRIWNKNQKKHREKLQNIEP